MSSRIYQIKSELATLEKYIYDFYGDVIEQKGKGIDVIFPRILFSLFRINSLLEKELWEQIEKESKSKGRRKKK